jgi:membrane-associated progesterone receptor component
MNSSEEYKVGPVPTGEVFQYLFSWLSKEFDADMASVHQFLHDLKVGKNTAIGTVVVTVGLGVWLTYLLCSQFLDNEPVEVNKKPKKDPIVPRDFTIEQLREFDGCDGRPIYIGLKGDVFDVSDASEYYGIGAPYRCFAGRNATRAMAKFSFEESELSNYDISDLGPFEKNTLDDWFEKFKYFKCYPIVGKYSIATSGLKLTVAELKTFNGLQELDPSVNRVNSPVYIGLKTKVYDVSYGGYEMYGKDGPYHRFAGRDISRALAKMSFDEADVNSSDISDLTLEQLKVLQEWIDKFEITKKYPVVGSLVDK